MFVLPCRIGDSKPYDTLADLGSSLNLIPLPVYQSLKLGKMEDTEVLIGLADGSIAYPVGVVKDVLVSVGRLTLLADFHILDMKSDPTCPLLVGRGFLATASALIDCKASVITIGEGESRSVYDVKKHAYDTGEEPIPPCIELDRRPSRYGPWVNGNFIGPQRPFYLEKDFIDQTHSVEQQLARDIELNPFEDPLVFRKMVEFLGALPVNLGMKKWKGEEDKEKWDWKKPPKEGDGQWHIRLTLYDPDGEKFENAYKTKPTNRKLKEKINPKDILNEGVTHLGVT